MERKVSEPVKNNGAVQTSDSLEAGRSGIAVAGDIIVDIVNILDRYPERNMLANVLKTVYSVGGCVPNTIIDLARIDSGILLKAIGKVGNDENGRYAVSELKKYGIDVSGIKIDESGVTSTSSVMTDSRTGERTFFYAGGANGGFDINDVNVGELDCRIFHIGYILLLDALDAYDAEYKTRMARLLDAVSQRGIKTSIDVVSEDGDRFAEKVIPALKYTDYAIVNEVESCRVAGVEPRNSDGSVCVENIRTAMQRFFEYGVRDTVVIHCVEAGFLMKMSGEFYVSGSLELPKGYIKGSVGAGDAYAAACLYGIYNGYEPLRMLEFAAAAAACNLSESDSVNGMKSREEIEMLGRMYGKRRIDMQI